MGNEKKKLIRINNSFRIPVWFVNHSFDPVYKSSSAHLVSDWRVTGMQLFLWFLRKEPLRCHIAKEC